MTTYKRHRYLLMATDPIHVGTGGYRLGRVDLSIVREPGTRVPKIPGTSLSGAIRAYAASQYGTLNCAGQGHPKEGRKGHCAQDNCPICYTFGYLQETGEGNDKKTFAYSGVVNLFDAHLLLFPVHSMAGPVWISTTQRLKEAGFALKTTSENDPLLDIPLGGGLYTWERKDDLNLGWLMLDKGPQIHVEAPSSWTNTDRWQRIQNRLVVVHEAVFGQAVNSNLEVRTSVSIDPERGTAEEGALFTYEALPRATFLVSEVVLDDYRDAFPKNESKVKEMGWKSALDVVQAGLRLAEWLGVGGMGTRGFGRLAIVGDPVEEAWK